MADSEYDSANIMEYILDTLGAMLGSPGIPEGVLLLLILLTSILRTYLYV